MPFHKLASRLVAAALVVVVGLAATRLAPVASGQEDGMGQIAGSWVWTHHFGPLGSMQSLVTFGKEGTVVGASGGMFGNPLGPTPEERSAKEGPLHGVWERDGAAGMRGVVIMARYDGSGMMVGFSRARTEVRLVDRDHMEGTSYLDVLGCGPAGPLGCPNPADPGAAWVPHPMVPPAGFVVTGTRIHVPMP